VSSPARSISDEVSTLQLRVAKLEQEIAEYRANSGERDDTSAALQYELAAARQRAEHKEHLLKEVLDSDSWRITKPLRSLAERFPGAASATRRAIKAGFRLMSGSPNRAASTVPAEPAPRPESFAASNAQSSSSAAWSDPRLESLLNSCPGIHGNVTYGLESDTLHFIDSHLSADSRTLETGSGLSTLLFAYRSTHHTCVTPWQLEVTRIERHCADCGIPTDRLRFVVGSSDQVLPHLFQAGSLDLVLIDGGNGFPLPFVDWLYSAPRLNVGGLLIVDDTHLWTGAVLRDFLSADPDWKLEASFAHGAAFRKINAFQNKEWNEQPYVLKRSKQ
jgi:hypothetical protein